MHNLRYAIRELALGLSFLIVGCSDSGSLVNSPASVEKSDTRVVARVGDRQITAGEIDEALKLQLYDLELARYDLRRRQLLDLIDSVAGHASAEIYLAVPEPPRIELPANRRSARGNPEAPVTISIFCSYESPHCKSIQPAMRRLASEYAGWTRQQLFDLPLKFHRQGMAAATAARCAERQGALWPFQDGLYAYSKTLNDDVYTRLAEQLELDKEAFRHCMNEDSFIEAIAADKAFAQTIGMTNVPVVFINGLYLRGPQSYDFYAQWVERELNRLGFDPALPHKWKEAQTELAELPLTDLPLALVGISLGGTEAEARALLEVRGARAQSVAAGAAIVAGVTLTEIHARFVVIDNQGRREKLLLRGNKGISQVPLTASSERDPELLRRIEQPLGADGRKLVDPAGVLPLGQQWLAEQLQNRAELEKKFVQAEMEVEGYHLMRLEGISGNEFFTALGFEENDVLLRVNDSWVHSGQNNLWDALTSGQVVDVAFMRSGLPQRLQYVVEERGYFEDAPADATSGNSENDEEE